ncbi:MAG: hypothetical protein AB7I08_12350 [Thermoleophilia bacterium]
MRGPQIVIQFAPHVTDEQAEAEARRLEKNLKPDDLHDVRAVPGVEARDQVWAKSLLIDLLVVGEPVPVAEVYRRAKKYALLYLDADGVEQVQPMPIGKDALREAWPQMGFMEKRVGFGGAVWLCPPGTSPPEA